MKRVNLSFAILSLLILLGMGGISIQAQVVGKLFTVNHSGDSADANVGDGICADAGGQCTLRAAIQESNTTQRNVIIFAMPWPTVINLTLGELAVTGNFTSIVGPGARRLSIQRSSAQGTPDFRIFHVPNPSTNVAVRGLSIKNGRAASGLPGGGIKVAAGSTLNLTDVSMTENVAQTGGGIANDGTLNITRSLIDSNSANTNGAAIINSANSVARITNSTITGGAALAGGAIHNNGDLLLVNNTISHNFALNTASSVFSGPNGSVRVLNTIIANDISPTAASIQGPFTSLGNNIITDARGSSGFTNGVNNDQVSDNNAIDPLLGDLANNGGQTDTRALLAGSPAIDTGSGCIRNNDCPTTPPVILQTDQRAGYMRLFAKSVDIGSFETEAAMFSGNGSFSSFSLGNAARHGGSIAILTDVITNQKRYSSVTPFGSYRFQNISLDVSILEIKSKRAGLSTGPRVFSFNDRPFAPFLTAEIQTDGNLIIREAKTEDRPK